MTHAAAFLLGNHRAGAFIVEPSSDKLGALPRA
jgi:hypothetical protein